MLQRDALTEETAFEAFSTILGNSVYQEAARKVSRRMRARKRTPLQEAGGVWSTRRSIVSFN